MSIAENLARIRERVAAAARRANRDPNEVRLMAVCKTMTAEKIREAYDAGQRLFGENRVQEFADKWPQLREPAGAEWHMIGHLQSNKAWRAAELFCAIDSLDSLRLARKLDQAALQMNKTLSVLVEINMGNEDAKSGFEPELSLSSGWAEMLLEWDNLRALEFRGFMCVPPWSEDPEKARPYFRKLRDLRDFAAQELIDLKLDVLSMGMSNDFEVAIEEGSTCVRVGTAIFGERKPRT